MKTKQAVYRVGLCVRSRGTWFTFTVNDGGMAKVWEQHHSFTRWLTDWVYTPLEATQQKELIS